MKAIFFSTSFVRDSLKSLKDCYGFDEIEIASELSYILGQHTRNKCVDENLLERCKDEKGHYDAMSYGLKSDDKMPIPVTDSFIKQKTAINKLCRQFHLKNKQLVNVLIFMAAIFDRNLNNLSLSPELQDVEQEAKWNAQCLRADLLRLFIALNQEKKGKSKGNPRIAEPVIVGYRHKQQTASNNQ